MNMVKLMAPDFILGKTLIAIKSLLDIIVLIISNPSKQSLKISKLVLQIKPRFTMVKNKNLVNLYCLVQQVNRMGLPGDIVECGVWKGGSAALMGIANKEENLRSKNRTIWLFDSFQGLPPPGEKDGSIERESYFEGFCKGDIDKVKQAFHQLNLSLDNVRIIPGWFESTLNTAPIHSVAVLHIDADWYESVKIVLDTFYDKVVPGGFIVLDDYSYWQGCNRAVEDFFAERGLEEIVIRKVDRIGAYFQKPIESQ